MKRMIGGAGGDQFLRSTNMLTRAHSISCCRPEALVICCCSTGALGEASVSDVELGLVTAPTLFALEEFPEMAELLQRRFAEEGDLTLATELVNRSEGVRRTQVLPDRCASGISLTL